MEDKNEILRKCAKPSVNGVKQFDLEWYLRVDSEKKDYATKVGKRPAYQFTSLEAKKHE